MCSARNGRERTSHQLGDPVLTFLRSVDSINFIEDTNTPGDEGKADDLEVSASRSAFQHPTHSRHRRGVEVGNDVQ